MKVLMAMLKMELVQYRKGLAYWVFLFAFSTYLYLVYIDVVDEIGIGQLLQSSAYVGMGTMFFGMFAGIIAAQREGKAQAQELFSTLPRYYLNDLAKILSWLLFCAFFTLIALVEVWFIIYLKQSELQVFFTMVSQYIVLYWGLPMAGAGIIGYTVERMFPGRWWTIPFVAIIWFLITPYNYIFEKQVPMEWLAMLNQGEREIHGSYNGFAGLNVTSIEWYKKLGFLFFTASLLLLALLLRPLRQRTKREKQVLAASFSLFVILTGGAFIIMPAHPLYAFHPVHSSGTNFANYYDALDHEYYSQVQEGSEIEASSTFTVNNYDITLMHKENLISYFSHIDVENINENGWIVFTLYHDLKVAELLINGEVAEWVQKGDHLYVHWLEGSSGRISLKVEGHGGVDSQVTYTSYYLSPLFPWYPVPGEHQLAELDFLNTAILVNRPLQLSKPAMFTIRTQESQRVFSHLPKVGEGHFEGKSRGASLLSGMILAREFGEYTVITPPDRFQEVESFIHGFERRLDELSNMLAVPKKPLPKNIFFVPGHGNPSVTDQVYYTGDVLLLNEGRIRFSENVTPYYHIGALFKAFYWDLETGEGERDQANFYVFMMLLELLDQGDSTLLMDLCSVFNSELKIDEANILPIDHLAREIDETVLAWEEEKLRSFIQNSYPHFKNQPFSLEEWQRWIELYDKEEH